MRPRSREAVGDAAAVKARMREVCTLMVRNAKALLVQPEGNDYRPP
jgi:hypothetical protein